jgi:hypothetical protein
MKVDESRSYELIEGNKFLGLKGRGFNIPWQYFLVQRLVNRTVDTIKTNVAREYYEGKPATIEMLKEYSDYCDREIKALAKLGKENMLAFIDGNKKDARKMYNFNRKERIEGRFEECKGYDVCWLYAKLMHWPKRESEKDLINSK